MQVHLENLEAECSKLFLKPPKEELLCVLKPFVKRIKQEQYVIGLQDLTAGNLDIYCWISPKKFADVIVGKPFKQVSKETEHRARPLNHCATNW